LQKDLNLFAEKSTPDKKIFSLNFRGGPIVIGWIGAEAEGGIHS
jgi:hypothetical protein